MDAKQQVRVQSTLPRLHLEEEARHQALRREEAFTFQFQTRVAIIIIKNIVYRSSRYAVLRVVNSIQDQM